MPCPIASTGGPRGRYGFNTVVGCTKSHGEVRFEYSGEDPAWDVAPSFDIHDDGINSKRQELPVQQLGLPQEEPSPNRKEKK